MKTWRRPKPNWRPRKHKPPISGIQRAQLEHAIALLTGQPASTFSISFAPLKADPPPIPFGVPSQLLERRPDIAAAERRVAEANAQIGVTKAAFFPALTLSGAAGFESTSFASWLTWPARFFSVGPALAQTLFDKGRRKAVTEQARAVYDGHGGDLPANRIDSFSGSRRQPRCAANPFREAQQQNAAVGRRQRTLALSTERYKSGIDSYLNVITAQTTLLTNQRTAVNLQMQQMTASVQLVKALGGGWNSTELPSVKELTTKKPENPKPPKK